MTGFRSVIAAGAAVVIVLALVGCTPKPAATPPSAPGTAPVNAADLAYCGRLASLYETYGSAQDRRGEDFDVGIAEAINQCHSGNAAAGIATLEKRLKDQDISLPPRQ
jgi:hypothetical protein